MHDPVSAHYSSDELGERILAAAAAEGVDPIALSPADLAPADQFHTGGRATTLELARLAGVQPGWRVVDVGGGIGGPARLLASEFGGAVTVVDLTEAFCRAGAFLTARLGLAARVAFVHGDALAMPFPDASFELAWTQHSSMNIADKEGLYREIHRVLRPGGRLALHEIMTGNGQPLHFPVPWARDPAISHLRPPDETRALIAAAGFTEVAWRDVTAESIAWFQSWTNSSAAGPSPRPLGLGLVLGLDFPTMGRNQVRNLTEGRIAVVQAVFDRD